MKSIRKRHKELAHATPHKLRHTGATAGTSIEAISEALTHSETGTTQIYVNNSNLCQHFKCHSNGCWRDCLSQS